MVLCTKKESGRKKKDISVEIWNIIWSYCGLESWFLKKFALN